MKSQTLRPQTNEGAEVWNRVKPQTPDSCTAEKPMAVRSFTERGTRSGEKRVRKREGLPEKR